MKLEATAPEIDLLLRLAELDAQAQSVAPETYRSRREAARKRVPPALLDRYENLREVGRFPVVVPMERGGCSGCHVRLPTMLEYKARRSTAIHSCPHCHRMLYAPELLDETASPAIPEGKPAVKRAPGAPPKEAPRAVPKPPT